MLDRCAAVRLGNAFVQADLARGPGGKAPLVSIAKDQIARPLRLLRDDGCCSFGYSMTGHRCCMAAIRRRFAERRKRGEAFLKKALDAQKVLAAGRSFTSAV
jgi:hypothetical protein